MFRDIEKACHRHACEGMRHSGSILSIHGKRKEGGFLYITSFSFKNPYFTRCGSEESSEWVLSKLVPKYK